MASGRSQATPLSAWLRVPVAWYHSSTHALFDDETHTSIRKCYTSPTDTTSQRHFCGYCGTPLSYWSETPLSEAEYICLTLASLYGDDLRDLEELGLIPAETDGEGGDDGAELPGVSSRAQYASPDTQLAHHGLPWFEKLMEGSRLAILTKSRGQGVSSDGRIQVEWEVTEWDGTDDSPSQILVTSKRKHDELVRDGRVVQD